MPDFSDFIRRSRRSAKIAIAAPGTPGDFRRSRRSAYKIARCSPGFDKKRKKLSCFSYENKNYLAPERYNLRMRSSEVCIKTRSPPDLLPPKDKTTMHTTERLMRPRNQSCPVEFQFCLHLFGPCRPVRRSE